MKPLFCNRLTNYILLLILCVPSISSMAKEIQLEMPNKLTGLAEYRTGNKDKPVILILHGFLQTSEFSTVQFIVNELIDNEYPILAPTLSLNIANRRQSLACDSVHTHNIEDNNLEVDRWIQWLKKQGYQSIVLIGHSTGNFQLISYLQTFSNSEIKYLIAVGPGTSWNPYIHKQVMLDDQLAEEVLRAPVRRIEKYSLGFCENNYMAMPENYRSYSKWTETYVLNTFEKLAINTQVIIGNSDSFLPSNWAEKLRKRNINVTVIDGANHFFNGDVEFMLQEKIINILNNQR